MPAITFIEPDGTEKAVEAAVGGTVMQAAVDNMIDGIAAECGGAMTCATCHAYVEEPWASWLVPASPEELSMLEFAVDTRPTSRLTCQILVTAKVDGLVVRVPENHY